MPVKRTIPKNYGTYFITFTCYRWLSLINQVNGFDIVYNWFDHLKSKGHFINGYVIMPNHLHLLISFINTPQTINTIVGNGKRFMAYEIVNRLKLNNEQLLLQQLENGVEATRRSNKKQHEIWELSFDWKECIGREFTWQKLNYIHANPCSGKWNLSNNPLDYKHSSAVFYSTGKQGIYTITNFMEMEDLDLGKNKQ